MSRRNYDKLSRGFIMGEVNIKSMKNDKYMSVLTDTTIRGIVNTVNKENIKKEDIVSLLKENGQFMMIYYKSI